MKTYLIRNIPNDIWKIAQHVRIEEGITFRELVLRALKGFCQKSYQDDEHEHDHVQPIEG